MGFGSIAEKLRIKNSLAREFFAEFLGTFVLIVLGDGAVAQMVLTQKSLATYLSVNFGYAMAVAFGVYVSGGVSGGHINPAVTLVMAVIGKQRPWAERKKGHGTKVSMVPFSIALSSWMRMAI